MLLWLALNIMIYYLKFFFLCRISSFSLSLDGKTPLPSEQTTTLSDLGIVGGDLLHVILNNDSARQSSNTSAGNHTGIAQSTTQSNNRTSSSGTRNVNNDQSMSSASSAISENQNHDKNVMRILNETSEDQERQQQSPKLQSLFHKEIDLQASGPSAESGDESQKQRRIEYTPKVLLCRDGTPYSLQSSYEVANVSTMHEAVCVAVHVLMLETGFVNHCKEVNKS